MKRLVASLTTLIFVIGMIALPALHRLHCVEPSAHHEASCPICHLATAPLDTVDTQVAIVSPPPDVAAPSVPHRVVPAAIAAHNPTQPRAPPSV